jgi:nicotinamide-nucleotide amidase
MRASILAIGDEIVAGLTTDTNSAFLAQVLRASGVEVVGFLAVADDVDAIRRALLRATDDAGFVVSTGGLGPTADDLTTSAVAGFVGTGLDLHEPSLRIIEERFRAMGVRMPPNNRKQAMLPSGSEPIPNRLGTAPGFAISTDRNGRSCHIICLPGVPREMKRMTEETVIPWIVRRAGKQHIGSRVFSTVGLTESALDDMLSGVVGDKEARLSFRAAFPRLQTRISIVGKSAEEVESRLEALDARIRDRLGDHVYAIGDEGLEETVGKLLLEKGSTLAVAESCTGGLIGHRITEVAGSSAYFSLGIVAYSNEMKTALLEVSPRTLEASGAVSEATVREMARGVRKASGAAIGLATSGIAGPSGGSDGKPVGTVCIGLAWETGEWSGTFQLGQRTREWIKEMTAQMGLDAVRRYLLDAPLDPLPRDDRPPIRDRGALS